MSGVFIDYLYPPPADLSSIQRPNIYKDIESNRNAYNNASLSFSTAQLGSENSRDCAENSLFWMGVGSDCRLACYNDILCEALFGQVRSPYLVYYFHIAFECTQLRHVFVCVYVYVCICVYQFMLYMNVLCTYMYICIYPYLCMYSENLIVAIISNLYRYRRLPLRMCLCSQLH